MKKHKMKLEIKISPSPFIPTEFIENEMKNALKYIDLLDERNYLLQSGEGLIEVKSNLSSVIENVIHNLNDLRPLCFEVNVPHLEGRADSASESVASYHIEQYVFDVWLLLNFSAPGCFSFHPKQILSDDRNSAVNDFFLEAHFFEFAWHDAAKYGWPKIGAIPLWKTVKWYDSLRIQTKQVADTRLQKAVFALLHVANSRFLGDPGDLIWLAHALEALFDTPTEGINKQLRNRICAVLDVPQESTKRVRKQINTFYQLRSRFVHGELKIAHPLANEILDKNVDVHRHSVADSIYFGFAIVLSTIQLMINQGWHSIEFMENFFGNPIEVE